jgi:hypothetical protein
MVVGGLFSSKPLINHDQVGLLLVSKLYKIKNITIPDNLITKNFQSNESFVKK